MKLLEISFQSDGATSRPKNVPSLCGRKIAFWGLSKELEKKIHFLLFPMSPDDQISPREKKKDSQEGGVGGRAKLASLT